MVKYCRYCDLGFCDRHSHEHEGFITKGREDLHEAVEGTEALCCICTGLVRPSS
jgi:hypothetical protein